jgi:hypothetical protein
MLWYNIQKKNSVGLSCLVNHVLQAIFNLVSEQLIILVRHCQRSHPITANVCVYDGLGLGGFVKCEA